MSDRRPYVLVVLAASILAATVGSLALRARSRGAEPEPPPASHVRSPIPVAPERLEFPCWSCREARDWPVRSRVDLDLVAPLGDGAGNAARFFAAFALASGERTGELAAARARRVEGPEDLGLVFPGDDPLLREAEPWIDQARMTFYPELLAVRGLETEIPDLLFALDLAKSWAARGRATEDRAAAREDFRRIVRLGRLLRQEDATILGDLVGIACLRIGLEELYDEARTVGAFERALVVSVALGELGPQRLLTSERVTRVELTPFLAPDRSSVALPRERFDDILIMASSDPDRRFRGEAILDLGVVRHLGPAQAQEEARKALEEIASGGDPVLSRLAEWALEHPPSKEQLAGMGG